LNGVRGRACQPADGFTEALIERKHRRRHGDGV
jgi:hypothetical protein